MIEKSIPLLDEILAPWEVAIGRDFRGYRNHVYRMVNFCLALRDCTDEERQKIVIAGCFHDIGIWTAGTFAYLEPSALQARRYLQQTGREQWTTEIEKMIDLHHRVRSYHGADFPLVEVFRRGDLVDFSLGVLKCGLPSAYVKEVRQAFPNAGFHKRLVKLEAGWLVRHPFNPVPNLKW